MSKKPSLLLCQVLQVLITRNEKKYRSTVAFFVLRVQSTTVYFALTTAETAALTRVVTAFFADATAA